MTNKKPTYTPNSYPLSTLLSNLIFSIGLLAYGAFGLLFDDLYVPGRHSKGMHFHGFSAITMFAAFICAALVLLSVIVDHYDKRNNEMRYQIFGIYMRWIGWALFISAIVLEIGNPSINASTH